jgi:hypothetical protein
MARRCGSVLGGLLLALALSACAAPRAIWVWEQASYDMVRDTASGDAALGVLRAKGIGTVYLYADALAADNLLVTRPELYRQFIGRAHRRGLRVYALLGSAFLHTEALILPGRRDEALAMFGRVLSFNAASRPQERFDGVNLDIEPHTLDQWPARKTELLAQFLELGQALMDLKRSSGQALAVGPDIPFWFDGIALDWNGRSASVSDHVLDIYDYATLMDYRDHASGSDGIVNHAKAALDYARRVHKKIVIGVEISPGEIRKVSFNHLAEADLERELALAAKSFRHNPAFGGFAIHHFRSYLDWLARGPG